MKNESLPKATELEYVAIRAEILKRIELRQQLIQITLVFAGTVCGLALNEDYWQVAFAYPPIALCLCFLWEQNDTRSRQLGKYVQILENTYAGLGWETYYRNEKQDETLFWKKRWPTPMSVMAPGATFILTEIMTIIIAWCRTWHGLTDWKLYGWPDIFIAGDILFLVLTVQRVQAVRKKSLSYRK